jgi:hypothetical protein
MIADSAADDDETPVRFDATECESTLNGSLVYPPNALRWPISPGFAAHWPTSCGTANCIRTIRVRLLA